MPSPNPNSHHDLAGATEHTPIYEYRDLPLSPRLAARRSYTQAFKGLGVGITPLSLDAGGLKNIFHHAGLVNDQGGKYECFRMADEDIKKCANKKVRQFYRKQNCIIDSFKEVDEILDGVPEPYDPDETDALLPQHRQTQDEKDDSHKAFVRWSIYINLVLNILLLAGKVMVVLVSNSVSLIASAIDSAMDLLSTVILFGASRHIERKDWESMYMYPVGKQRMEPMGIVIFSVFMISSFIQVFIESCKRLLEKDADPVEIPLQGIIVMIVTIIVKIAVWAASRNVKSSTVQALGQDAENDVVFNFFSLIFPWLGQKFGLPWLDPAGGIVLSLYIVYEWSVTLYTNVKNLTGTRSAAEEHMRVAYLVSRFSPHVSALQHVEVYQSGDQQIAEVDIILPADTALPRAHNIGESVQYALECLPGIERAYCHVDYNPNNPSGHRVR